MRNASKICVITAIVLWVVAAFALLMTWIGTQFLPAGYAYESVFDKAGNQWIMPAWDVSLGLVAFGISLCIGLKKKEKINWLPLLLGVAGAIVGLVVALELKSALPAKVGIHYTSQGLTAWRLIWRHFTPVIAGLLAALAAHWNRIASRDERILAENEAYKEHYDLSGDPIFAESESTIGLDSYAEDFSVKKKPAHRLKRSLRNKKKKEQ